MDIRPPPSGSCSCFSFPPLCLYSQRQHQVVDSKYMSWSPQGIHASAGVQSAEHLTLSPRALPHTLIPSGYTAKMSKGKKEREPEAADCVEFYLFFKSVLSWSLPVSGVRTVGSVRWPCLIVWLPPLREIEGSTCHKKDRILQTYLV